MTSKLTGPGVGAAERSEPGARIRLRLSVLFWAVTCAPTSRMLWTAAHRLAEVTLTHTHRIVAEVRLSRYTSLCRPSRPQPNGVSCGHRATPLATGNGSGVTRRGPYFGLGKPAIELSIIRSADSLTCPTTQGGAYARCTRVRLPWATVLNAFGVSVPRIGPRPRTIKLTGHAAQWD
jgi:hypothetical protein